MNKLNQYVWPHLTSRAPLGARTTRHEQGFTLVELLVVVVLVAILAMISVPQYNEFVQDSRRSEGQSALTQIATMQEQFHAENNTYTADLRNLGFSAQNWNDTENENYQVRVMGATTACPITNCFRLRAQPKNNSEQWGDDWRFEVWSDGRRTVRACPKNVCGGSATLNGWGAAH